MSKSSTKPTPTVTVKLLYPIEYGEEGLVTEVKLKRLKGKHILDLGADITMSVLLNLAGKSSGYPPSFFKELDAADCTAISEVMGGFLEPSQKIGKTA